jgi:hypothetical protein
MPNNHKSTWDGIRDLYVIPEIDVRVNLQLPTGTVQSITAGAGLSATPNNPITSIGTIVLDAGISDLNNTNISTPLVCDQILSWNGTSWINKAYPGLSGTSFSFVDLKDVNVNLATEAGKILSINTAGTSVVSVANNFLTSDTGVNGIKTTLVGSAVTTEFYPPSITTQSIASGDYLVYYKNTVGARRQIIDQVNISLFNDDLDLLTGGDLKTGTAITITSGADGSQTIGVCTSQIAVDFNAGVCGILGIPNGGTSGSTSASARTNLGLEYNVDILTKTGPSFTGNMFGNNITLLSSSFGLSLIKGGTCYSNGTILSLLNPNTNYTITTAETITVDGSGVITGPSQFSLSISNIGLSDSNTTLYVDILGGGGASYQLQPDPSYLLFGGSTAGTGVGLRDRQGIIELKSTHTGDGSTWQQVFPLAVGGLCDVTTSSLANNQFLIYNLAGTSFVNTTLTGNTDYSFAFNQAGSETTLAITPLVNTIGISKLDSSVTKTEFDYLSGTISNIQDQLDNRIGTSPNGTEPSAGDMVWYSGTCWSILRAPDIEGNYILGVSNPNYIPHYSYLHSYTTTEIAANESWLNDEFVYVKSGVSPAYRTTLPSYLDSYLCNPTGGLGFNTVPRTLELDLDNLTGGTCFNTPSTDKIIYYNSTTDAANKMTIIDLASSLAGTNLTGNTDGTISILNGLSTPLKLKRYTTGLSLHTDNAPASWSGAIAGVSTTGAGTSLAFCDGTSWYYVTLGNYVY